MIGQRVRVHLNLQNGLWSITQGGRVVAHVQDVTLHNVTFYVSEATRQRVLKFKRRRVHAWAQGTLVATDTQPITVGHTAVTYNPYRASTFTTLNGEPMEGPVPVMHFVGRYGWATWMPPCQNFSAAGRQRQ